MLPSHPWLARLAAVCALVAWTVGLVGPMAVVHAEADVACGDVAWTSDHDRPAFEDVRPPVDGGHCELCHHQRTLRGAMDEARGVSVIAPVGLPFGRSMRGAVAAAPESSLPARAPPSSHP